MIVARRVPYPSLIRVIIALSAGSFLAYAAGYQVIGESRDYYAYALFFDLIDREAELSLYRFELGYSLSVYVSKFIFGLSYEGFTFLLLALSFIINFYSFSGKSNLLLVFIFFILSWYPLHEYTQVRVAIALSFLFVSIKKIGQERLLTACIWGILSTLFHASAAVLFPFLVIVYLLRHRSIWISLFSVTFMSVSLKGLFLISAALLSSRSPNILVYLEAASDFEIRYFSIAHILMAGVLLSAALSGGLKQIESRISFLIAFASFPLMFAFSEYPVIAIRFKELFMCFSILFAFQRKLTWAAIPQITLALLYSFASAFTFISSGVL